MFYRKYAPSDLLVPFVECYFIWESEGIIPETLEVESPPNGFCSIVFNYGDLYYLQNKKYERLKVPRQFVSGQNIYSYKLFLEGTIGIAGIVFKPAALATIFQLPVYEYTEERIDLYRIFKKEVVDKYATLIRDAVTEEDRVKVLDDFLILQYHLHKPEPDYIDHAANLIVEKNGLLQVTDLLKESCMSRRSFERKFFQKVGLSPKYYARIRRIGYLMNLIAGKKKADWSSLFHECEYYDQAHFIKDFEEFTGRSPQQYLKENLELANYVVKPSLRAFK
ncbi:MAG TPA: helix-turn-helix domain-containing protein [Chitinophagaceae bacterium]